MFIFSKRRRQLEHGIIAKRVLILSIVRSRQNCSWTDALKLLSFTTSGVFVNALIWSYLNAMVEESLTGRRNALTFVPALVCSRLAQ